ncbi:HEAT repeat domain-containing protein [Dethiothermospora halolimnae]|uniref:HEAT repeat domain-containing protein n=1 Tax=Dethiothermospora halolimnae TaxID=3114390 RepID=UPI003CCC0A7B
MKKNELRWNNIQNIDDPFISYMLYLEGKTTKAISIIRGISKKEVENHIIKSKMYFNNSKKTDKNNDLLVKLLSLDKHKRLLYLKRLDKETKNRLCEDIYKRYIKFKNLEDKMILIWLIGELKDKKLLPLLRMELRNRQVNIRRLACSALGKIKDDSTREWLENMILDDNPQVRQYAIKALSHIGDDKTIEKLKGILSKDKEKEYVKKAAIETIDKIKAI